MVQISPGMGLLDDACSFFAAKLSSEVWKNHKEDMPRTLEIGSFCSGTDILGLVSSRIMQEIHEHTGIIDVNVVCNFVCEKDKSKQVFLQKLEHISSNPECCIYDDAHEICKGYGMCLRHKKQCKAKRCELFGSGFSCTAVSPMNMNSKENKGSMRTSGQNPTADTFRSSIEYMRAHRPKITIMENLDRLDDKPDATPDMAMEEASSNLEQTRDSLIEAGYLSFVVILNSKDYGVPQDRPRIYIGAVALEVYQYSHSAALRSLQLMSEAIQHMKIPECGKMQDFLLQDDDDMVINELRHWEAVKEAQSDKDSRDTLWRKKHQAEFAKAGLRWGHEEAPVEVRNSPWYQALPPREQDLILFTILTSPDAVSLDTSQSLGRHRVRKASQTTFPTVTPCEKRYMLDRQRLRTGYEALSLQAFPWQLCDVAVDCNTLHSLAGNAWTGTVCMAVVFSMIMYLPWTGRSIDQGHEGIDDKDDKEH